MSYESRFSKSKYATSNSEAEASYHNMNVAIEVEKIIRAIGGDRRADPLVALDIADGLISWARETQGKRNNG